MEKLDNKPVLFGHILNAILKLWSHQP